MGQDPSVSESNWLHVVIFWFVFSGINLAYIPQNPWIRSVILLKSQTSTGSCATSSPHSLNGEPPLQRNTFMIACTLQIGEQSSQVGLSREHTLEYCESHMSSTHHAMIVFSKFVIISPKLASKTCLIFGAESRVVDGRRILNHEPSIEDSISFVVWTC